MRKIVAFSTPLFVLSRQVLGVRPSVNRSLRVQPYSILNRLSEMLIGKKEVKEEVEKPSEENKVPEKKDSGELAVKNEESANLAGSEVISEDFVINSDEIMSPMGVANVAPWQSEEFRSFPEFQQILYSSELLLQDDIKVNEMFSWLPARFPRYFLDNHDELLTKSLFPYGALNNFQSSALRTMFDSELVDSAHFFLNGPRGIGKNSIAQLFALSKLYQHRMYGPDSHYAVICLTASECQSSVYYSFFKNHNLNFDRCGTTSNIDKIAVDWLSSRSSETCEIVEVEAPDGIEIDLLKNVSENLRGSDFATASLNEVAYEVKNPEKREELRSKSSKYDGPVELNMADVLISTVEDFEKVVLQCAECEPGDLESVKELQRMVMLGDTPKLVIVDGFKNEMLDSPLVANFLKHMENTQVLLTNSEMGAQVPSGFTPIAGNFEESSELFDFCSAKPSTVSIKSSDLPSLLAFYCLNEIEGRRKVQQAPNDSKLPLDDEGFRILIALPESLMEKVTLNLGYEIEKLKKVREENRKEITIVTPLDKYNFNVRDRSEMILELMEAKKSIVIAPLATEFDIKYSDIIMVHDASTSGQGVRQQLYCGTLREDDKPIQELHVFVDCDIPKGCPLTRLSFTSTE